MPFYLVHLHGQIAQVPFVTGMQKDGQNADEVASIPSLWDSKDLCQMTA